MAAKVQNKEDPAEDSEKGVQEGVRDVEEVRVAKRRDVSAVENEEQRENKQPLAPASTHRISRRRVHDVRVFRSLRPRSRRAF